MESKEKTFAFATATMLVGEERSARRQDKGENEREPDDGGENAEMPGGAFWLRASLGGVGRAGVSEARIWPPWRRVGQAGWRVD